MRTIFAILTVGFSLYATSACVAQTLPSTYSAKPISATVVDHETGGPLGDVVVVAVWELKPISGRGPRLQVTEVVTDAAGRFEISGWGPKPRPALTEFMAGSPYLLLFKSQYVAVRLHNAPRKEFAWLRARTGMTAQEISDRGGVLGDPSEPVQEAVWDGMVLRLARFNGTPEQWYSNLAWIADSVARDDAKYVARFYRALGAEREYFKRHRVESSFVTPVANLFTSIEQRIGLSEGRR